MSVTANEAKYLTDLYKGKSWSEISSQLSWSNQVSHTGYYKNKCYVVVCNRQDICKEVCLLEQ